MDFGSSRLNIDDLKIPRSLAEMRGHDRCYYGDVFVGIRGCRGGLRLGRRLCWRFFVRNEVDQQFNGEYKNGQNKKNDTDGYS